LKAKGNKKGIRR